MKDDLIFRLRKRAEIRRSITTRKSVQLGEPDRIADLLDEAADALQAAYYPKLICGGCGKCLDCLAIERGTNGLSHST